MDEKPIICSRKGCGWRGYESQMSQVPDESYTGVIKVSKAVCPKCGCDSYYFMTDRQIKWWEKQKAKKQEAAA